MGINIKTNCDRLADHRLKPCDTSYLTIAHRKVDMTRILAWYLNQKLSRLPRLTVT